MFNKNDMLKKLSEMHNNLWNKEENRYNNEINELVFLDVFNNYRNYGKILILCDIFAKSFNTIEEFRIFENLKD